MILAGDIGGTHTRLAMFDGDDLTPRQQQTYKSQDHPGLAAILRSYLNDNPVKPEVACFGVAGPVIDGKVEATNLAWSVDSATLADVLDLPAVDVINDLVANAYGVLTLEPQDVAVLNPGVTEEGGNIAVVSAGTGLGEAYLIQQNGDYAVVPSEGGHTDFAPRTELEFALHRFVFAEYDHVSYERVCSGPGLVNIHRFYRAVEGPEMPEWLRNEMHEGDPAAVISRHALDNTDDVCRKALDLMISIYAAKAANTAVAMLTTGGLYLGGGIPPKIVSRLMTGGFVHTFTDKGRFSGMMRDIPVKVIMNEHTALRGAARRAAKRVSTS